MDESAIGAGLLVRLASQSGVRVGHVDGQLLRSFDDQLSLLGGHGVTDLRAVLTVQHHQHFELLWSVVSGSVVSHRRRVADEGFQVEGFKGEGCRRMVVGEVADGELQVDDCGECTGERSKLVGDLADCFRSNRITEGKWKAK